MKHSQGEVFDAEFEDISLARAPQHAPKELPPKEERRPRRGSYTDGRKAVVYLNGFRYEVELESFSIDETKEILTTEYGSRMRRDFGETIVEFRIRGIVLQWDPSQRDE